MDGRRVRSEETWAAARDAYLAGAGAAEVCERFDLGLSALRLRARREGWRKSDRPDPAPDELHEILEDEVAALVADPPAPSELAAQAWARAASALGRGRLREAQGWTRLWRDLTVASDIRERARDARAHAEHREVMDEACRATRSIVAALKAAPTVKQAVARTARADELHSLHSLHPVSSAVGDATAVEAQRPHSSSDAFGYEQETQPHSMHSAHSDPSVVEADAAPRPLNRAERRRRERLAAKTRPDTRDRLARQAESPRRPVNATPLPLRSGGSTREAGEGGSNLTPERPRAPAGPP